VLTILAFTGLTLTLAAVSSLTPVYIVCLVAGGGLLVFSLLSFGGGDSDVDADTGGADFGDADVAGADGDALGGDLSDAAGGHDGIDTGHAHGAHSHGAMALSKWLSLRFLIYFAATFGLVGTVLSYMTDLSPMTVAGWALAGGIVVGQAVHQAIRALQRTEVNSAPREADFLEQTARVTRPILPGVFGEISINVGSQEYFLPAQPQRPDDCFAVGETVVVAEYHSGTAKVVSRAEHEFLKA
jgi:hypothetical protein